MVEDHPNPYQLQQSWITLFIKVLLFCFAYNFSRLPNKFDLKVVMQTLWLPLDQCHKSHAESKEFFVIILHDDMLAVSKV